MQRSLAFIFVFTLLSFTQAVSLHGQLIGWSPYNGLTLGKSISGNDYLNPKGPCISGGTPGHIKNQSSQLAANIVFTQSEYKKAFNIDQSASASFLGIGGGGEEIHFGEDDDRSSRLLDIVLVATITTDSDTYTGAVDWAEPYKGRIAAGQRDSVRADCGDRYISTQFNEARLYVVIHVSSTQMSQIASRRWSIKATANIGIATASSKLGGDDVVRSSNQAGALHMQVYTQGIDNSIEISLQSLGITSSDGLQSIADKMINSLKNAKVVGKPVAFQLTALPGMDSNDLTLGLFTEKFLDLKGIYYDAASRNSNLSALLNSHQEDPRVQLFTDLKLARAKIKDQKFALETFMAQVSDAHTKCRNANKIDICIAAEHALPPPPLVSPVELPFLTPVTTSAFYVFVDGKALLPQQAIDLFRGSNTTLLREARKLKPAALQVDVLAPIVGSYLERLEFPILSLNPASPPASSLTVHSQSLPQSFDTATGDSFRRLVLLHADDGNPCPIGSDPGGSLLAVSCLTPVGRYISRQVSGEMALLAASNPGASTIMPFGATWRDCWMRTADAYLQPPPGGSFALGAASSFPPPSGSFGLGAASPFPLTWGSVSIQVGPEKRSSGGTMLGGNNKLSERAILAAFIAPGFVDSPFAFPDQVFRVDLGTETRTLSDWVLAARSLSETIEDFPRGRGTDNCSVAVDVASPVPAAVEQDPLQSEHGTITTPAGAVRIGVTQSSASASDPVDRLIKKMQTGELIRELNLRDDGPADADSCSNPDHNHLCCGLPQLGPRDNAKWTTFDDCKSQNGNAISTNTCRERSLCKND